VAAGARGQRAVLFFCFLELVGASIVLLMIAWQNLELLLPSEGGSWAGGMRCAHGACMVRANGCCCGWRSQMLTGSAPPTSTGIGPLRPMHLAAVLSSAALLPLLFIELRQLSALSALGAASTALVVGMVLVLLGLDPQRTAMPQQARH
jgi:vesicular inhibitory amino acid transporter